MKFIVFAFLAVLVGCQTQTKPHLQRIQISSQIEVKKKLEELEKENMELQLRNSILLKALSEKKKSVKTDIATQQNNPKQTQPFPQFDELIYDQAQTAFENKDLERLQEALRILRTNHAESRYLPKIYIWLSDIQIQKLQHTQALITLDEFIKFYPKNEFTARALYLKAKLYEKLSLPIQAREVYKSIQENYPQSKEKDYAEAMLKERSSEKVKQ